MSFAAVGLVVVMQQIIMQPLVRFRLGFRFVKMVQRFVGFFNGPKRSFYFAFSASRYPQPVLALRDVSGYLDPQAFK